MVGIDPDSDGLARAAPPGGRRRRPRASKAWSRMPGFDDIDDRLRRHLGRRHRRQRRAALRRTASTLIDLTPAAIGPYRRPAGQPRRPPRRRATSTWSPAAARRPSRSSPRSSPVAPVPYAEIVASIASRSAGPGTRANIDEFTETTAPRHRDGRRRRPRQGDHRPQPGRAAADHARHRALPGRAPTPTTTRSRVGRGDGRRGRGLRARLPAQAGGAVRRRSPRRRAACTRCRRRRAPAPTHQVSVFLEVEGAAHYLPAYAGNLDIMTSAALRVAETHGRPRQPRRPPMTVSSTSRTSPCGTACTHPAPHRPRQASPRSPPRSTPPASTPSRSPTATAWPAARSTTAPAPTPTGSGSRPPPRRRPTRGSTTLLLPGIGTIARPASGPTTLGRPLGPRRHALHRGRHLRPAHRRRPRARAWTSPAS